MIEGKPVTLDLERFVFLHRLTCQSSSRDSVKRANERLAAWQADQGLSQVNREIQIMILQSERLRTLVLEGCVESAIRYRRQSPLSAFGNVDCELLFLRYQCTDVEDFLSDESARLGLDSSIAGWLDDSIHFYGLEEPPNPFEQITIARTLGICEENCSLFLNNCTFRVGLDSRELIDLFYSYGAGRGKAIYEAWGRMISLEGLLITDSNEASVLERILCVVSAAELRSVGRGLREFWRFMHDHGSLMQATTVRPFEEFKIAIQQKKQGVLTKV